MRLTGDFWTDVMLVLTTSSPCDCVMAWHGLPPCGWTCEHMQEHYETP